HFTPSWFAVSMGVGVHISLFHNFPFNGGHQLALDVIATIFLVFNVVLFIAMVAMTIARYSMFPQIWGLMIHHPVQSLFLGCIPMALATIINGLVIEVYQRWHLGGSALLYATWGIWWFDVALSLLSNFVIFHLMITRHSYELSTSSAVWLLPVVPSIVTGTTGAIVAGALADISESHAVLTTIMASFMLAVGLLMSFFVLALYTHRLLLHGFPTAGQFIKVLRDGLAVSIFLPLGPFGQGGYGLLLVGDLFRKLLPQSTSPDSILAEPGFGVALQAITFVFAFMLWVIGIWFLIPATIALSTFRGPPFGLPYWGLIFPTSILVWSSTPHSLSQLSALHTTMPPKKKSKSKVPEPEPDYEEEEPLVISTASIEEGDNDDDSVTRCVCGSQDEELGMMIQCEICKVWQHGMCVGIHSEALAPDTYYCEQCRPDMHADLLASRQTAQNISNSSSKKSSGHHQRAASSNVMPVPSHDGPHQTSISSHQQRLTASNLASNNNLHNHSSAAPTSNHSVSHSSSRSTSPPTKSSMPKRRNTLNSREAAYEEALERGDIAAMEKLAAPNDDDDESGALMDVDGPGKDNEAPLVSMNGIIKADPARKPAKRSHKAKEKEPSLDIDDNASLSVPPISHGGKKHANQYTYRVNSKVPATTSPAKSTAGANRAAGSVVPDDRPTPTPNNSHRKGATAASKAKDFPPSPQQPAAMSWSLPDHLSHLSDLLPTPMQGHIDVPIGGDEFVPERGAKVKWPLKRTTIGEMRRRVRAMLDFCTKAQVDVAERAKRSAALEAFIAKAGEMGLEGVGTTATGRNKKGNDTSIDVDVVAAIMATPEVMDPHVPEPGPIIPKAGTGPAMDVSNMTTAELLASLTQDLLAFQEKFGAGPGGKVYREAVPRERRPRGAAAAALLALERSE
ncbi:Plasma membrane sulfite pump involved in sulfite metabolism, partial [Tulasnella sp. 427]